MAKPSPQTSARSTMTALLIAARNAGWRIVKGEVKPDGTVIVDVRMADADEPEDFLGSDLRMVK